MSWTALSKQYHLDMVLKKFTTLEFLREDVLVSICSFELVNCASKLPIIFAADKGNVRPFGLMGLEKGKNLALDPNGKWRIGFFPATLAAFPFRLGMKDDGEKVVVFFNDSKFIEPGGKGERLFDKDGSESEVLKHYIKLLGRIEKSNVSLDQACQLLKDADILEPFGISLQSAGNKEENLEGLLRINSEKFKALDDKKILELRENMGLDLAYAHFYSMGSIHNLEQIRMMDKEKKGKLNEIYAGIIEEDSQELTFDKG